MELKKIKCPSCGGELNIPEDSDEMKCRFCGTRVIIDDKATEVGRIKKAEIKAKKELDEHELENKKKNDNYNDEREYKKKKDTGKLKGWSIAMTIICFIFTFSAFRDGKILSGIIGVIQIVAFGYATLLCLDVLPEKMKNFHKIAFMVGCALIIPFISFGDVRVGGNSFKDEIEDLVWSDYVLSEKLPEPKTLKGKLNYDSSSSLSIDIAGVDKNEYKSYVNACKEKGFNIDIYNSSDSFRAKNEEGYSLYLSYDDDDKEYSISLREPEKETNNESIETNEEQTNDNKTESNSSTTESNGLRTNFKNAMDSYESFMNEYVEFMKKYNANPTSLTLLNQYSSYLEKYNKFAEDFDKWDEEDMNDAELKYYLEVLSRVTNKLSELA